MKYKINLQNFIDAVLHEKEKRSMEGRAMDASQCSSWPRIGT